MAAFIQTALEQGASAVLTDAEGARGGRGAGGSDVALVVAEDPRAGAGLCGGAVVRGAARDDGRGDRHERQDLGRDLHPPDLGRRWAMPRSTSARRGRGGLGRRPRAHTTPEPITLHRAAGRGGEGGRDPCGDGGLVPRARPAAAGRGAAAAAGSPTSRRITWTITARWRPISRPRRSFSPAPARGRGGGGQPRRSQGIRDGRAGAGGAGLRVLTVGKGPGADLRSPASVRRDRAGAALLWHGPRFPGAAEPDRRLPGRERAVAAGLASRGVRGPAAVLAALPRLTGCAAGCSWPPRGGTARRSSSTTPIRPTPSPPRCRRCARM
jgi:UDP-N-acetylmuramoyl-L-alanyl-D-glutamate--2,6-diaminopimelate ligase